MVTQASSSDRPHQPDRFLGLFKCLFPTSLVYTMTDIVRVVKESSPSGKNKAQLTVTSSGSREVHWIDWFRISKIPSITTYQHFRAEPGIVTVKKCANSPEEKIGIFKKDVT